LTKDFSCCIFAEKIEIKIIHQKIRQKKMSDSNNLSKTEGNKGTNKQKSHSRKLLRRSLSSNRPSCKNDAAKKKNHSCKLLRRSLSSNKPSCKNDAAKIQINRENAIKKLTELEKNYLGINQIYGFLTNVKKAIGLQPSKGASEYGFVIIPKENNTTLTASISLTNHHGDARTYIDRNANYEYNLKIAVKKSKIKGIFRPDDDVLLDEYEYTGKELKKVDNALALIIRSIVGFLQTGLYEDLTGVAIRHRSP